MKKAFSVLAFPISFVTGLQQQWAPIFHSLPYAADNTSRNISCSSGLCELPYPCLCDSSEVIILQLRADLVIPPVPYAVRNRLFGEVKKRANFPEKLSP